MTRPTRDDLAHAQSLIEELATRYDSHNNPNLWPDLITLLDVAVWLDGEMAHAKAAAVYGPGGERSPEGGGTIGGQVGGGRGLSRPTEARLDFGTDTRPRLRPELNDPLYRTLRNLRSGLAVELGQLVDSARERCKNAARWPTRTSQ